MKLSEPWYTYTKYGIKTIEARVNDTKRQKMQAGDTILFTLEKGATFPEGDVVAGFPEQFMAVIQARKEFTNFEQAIRYAKLKNILPGVRTYNGGVEIYNDIPGYKENASKYGVVIFLIKKI